MSYEIELVRSNHKIAHSLILQYILQLKARNEEKTTIDASELAVNLKIPYKTVQSVMHDLYEQGYISNLQQK